LGNKKIISGVIILFGIVIVIGLLTNESLKDNEPSHDLSMKKIDIINFSSIDLKFKSPNAVLLEKILENQEEIIRLLQPETKPVLEALTTVNKICQFENEENCINWKVESNLGYDNVFCINKIAFGTVNIVDSHLLNDQFPEMKGTQLLIYNVTGLCD